uniref:Uncharacterized protein n=1 Tax=Arundo donax TaxID=35708 RepID=A0A0A9C361_ARUDO
MVGSIVKPIYHSTQACYHQTCLHAISYNFCPQLYIISIGDNIVH